jgi:quercetin dioxygenase-like cupin family protein
MMKTAALLIAMCLPVAAMAQAQPAPMSAQAQAHGHSHDGDDDAPAGSIKPKQVVPATATSPAFIQLAKNVEVIPDIEKVVNIPAAQMTHEGRFGPLLFAENNRAFFIELQPGMFLGEHPHETGSIIYTVRGKWVLASEGKRQVMEPGSLFRFGDGMPTGWEAPFNEPALLLVVKGKQGREDYATFNAGIKSMQATVDKDRKAGGVYYFNELKPDHAAIKFARSVNPKFDDVLKIKY